MQRHPHAELRAFGPGLPVERTLGIERGRHRVGRRVERRAESVATRLEDMAVMIVDALAQQRIVTRERGAHRRGVRFPQARAALDVGEQQRDGAGRKVCHRVASLRAPGRGGPRE